VTQLFVALDFASLDKAVRLAKALLDEVDGFKVGPELLYGAGPAALSRIVDLGNPVFADAKLHDIPNTVERATRQLGRLGVRFVTVHGSGGTAMIGAACEGLNRAGVLAVTVLTSLDDSDLAATGVGGGAAEQVGRLAALAASAGAEGVVCSVHELELVGRSAPGLLRVTPGIRVGASHDDQARTASPQDAARLGADIIVVGRPITRADDPVGSAHAIQLSIQNS